jgi:hypothetical protein
MILNIDRNWTRLVKLRCKLFRHIQVDTDRSPRVVRVRRRS